MRMRTKRAGILSACVSLLVACSRGSTPSASSRTASALKPIDRAALQTMVDTTAREMLVPGALVLLRTPQGEFTFAYGTTQLGSTTPPRADTTSGPPRIPRR